MINFFKNIFHNSNQKKAQISKSDDVTRIYFDRLKRTYLELKIPKEFSCQDIHSNYHNEILGELMRNNSSVTGNGNYSKILNANEFAFMILDDENPYTEIKLKMKDVPGKFIKKKTINLYYLNMNPQKKEESSGDNKVVDMTDNYAVNTVSTLSSLNSTVNTNSNVGANFNFTNFTTQEESVREGELLKYSFKHKKFDKRVVVLDKEKLIITKPKNKESTILLLSDISAITKDISDKAAKDRFTFEITTFEGDHYIFKSKHNADLETWIESIYMLLSLIRDNKFIIKYGDQINKLVKDTYEKGMKIIYNCLSLRGLISIKETRELIFK